MRSYLVILLLSFGLLQHINAQQVKTVRGIGVWSGVGLDFRLKENYTFKVLQDFRLNNNFTQLDRAISEVGFAYKINKYFKLATDLRFSLNRKKDMSFNKDLRYNLDFSFRTKIYKAFGLSYRLRFQQLFENALHADRGMVGDKVSNLRNKLSFFFKLEKNKPFVSVELFRAFESYRKPYFNQLRLQMGNEWENRLGEFEFALAYERELSDPNPLHFFFAKIYYTFKLRKD